MPRVFDEDDLDAFFDAGEFAVEARIARAGFPDLLVTGIFDAAWLDATLGEYALDTDQPRFLSKAAAVKGVARGDVVTIGDESFDVLTAPQADGTGLATLAMSRKPS